MSEQCKKYSHCTALKIAFFRSDNCGRISIEDNGKGFANTYFSGGSGIENIKSRAKEAGLLIKWQIVQPSGRKVIIAGGKIE